MPRRYRSRQPEEKIVNVRYLRKAIREVLPFDIDAATAKVITDTIFKTIVKGVERDGFVTIPGLGRFYKGTVRERYAGTYNFQRKAFTGLVRCPERTEIRFTMCKGLNHALREKGVEDAQS